MPSPPRSGDSFVSSLQPSQALPFSTFTTRSSVACDTSISYLHINCVDTSFILLPLVDEHNQQPLLSTSIYHCFYIDVLKTHTKAQQSSCTSPPASWPLRPSSPPSLLTTTSRLLSSMATSQIPMSMFARRTTQTLPLRTLPLRT